MIFTGGDNKSIKLIMSQIRRNEKASGQKVNNGKSFFVTAPNTSASRINRIRRASRFMDKWFPFNYLGYPIYHGRKKISLFDDMLAQIVKKLNDWQGKMLSYGAEMVLIKHVLQSLPTHILCATNPPKSIIKFMEKIFNNFSGGLLKERTTITGLPGIDSTYLRMRVEWG